MKEKAREIAKRLTGISLPGGFGVSWSASNTDRDIAKRLIAFLEDRRVLYNPGELEVPHHCVESVLEIRHFITDQLAASGSTELQESLRALRAAARKFLDLVGVDDHASRYGSDIIRHGSEYGHHASWVFNAALGELRGVFGIHLAKVAVMYKIDVEQDLASIFPQPDTELG